MSSLPNILVDVAMAFLALHVTGRYSQLTHKVHGRAIRLSKLGVVRADLIQVQIGAIKAANTGRRALHEKLGFALVGNLPQVAFKFGGWLTWCSLLLDTPAQPVNG